jgi:galactose oxidase-like protein
MVYRWRRALLWALAAGSLSCGGDEGTSPGGAAELMAVSGGGQKAPAGAVLPESLVVVVTDQAGEPVSNIAVEWAVAGGGIVTPAVDTTASDGRSAVQRTLGPSPGPQITTASAAGLGNSSVTFEDTAVAATAPTMSITTQPPGAALDQEVWVPESQPVVNVRDEAGNALPGVGVAAQLVGAGTLEGELTATTEADGSARFVDLGVRGPGVYSLTFSADGAGSGATATSSQVVVDPLPPEASLGHWDPAVDWDIVPLHMHLLPTGKILAWGKLERDGSMGNPRLWDPALGPPTTATIVRADTMLFCAGHAFMADGRLMVSGGHKADDQGLDVTNIFDPVTEAWLPGLPKMARGRWYPTVTTLPDGRLVTVAGRDTTSGIGAVVGPPEVWEEGRWVQLPGADRKFPYYPRDFVAPDGRVFYAGEMVQSRWLEVDAITTRGRGAWRAGPKHRWPFERDYGSAAMYEPGKILYAGGGGDPRSNEPHDTDAATPTATAETIDLNASAPQWQSTGDMHFARRHLNATILPDGRVLVTGGVSAGGFNTLASAVHAAEVWDPATGQWTELAAAARDRGYHSVALLLPDATVLAGSGGDAEDPGSKAPYPAERNHEIYRPPYLYKGARPIITGSPGSVGYGQTFTVTSPNSSQIVAVRWIRLGSVTHAFNANQRANTLEFTRGSGSLAVDAPASPNLAPPGHYLLFILNRNGVPSEGKVVGIR